MLFAVVWVFAQATLVLTADRRPDGVFGFRTFHEMTTLKLSLSRDVIAEDGLLTLVQVEHGTWMARDAGGLRRHVSWTDRVMLPDLGVFDTEIVVQHGAAALLGWLQAALDDVATHTPEDAETRRLHLDVVLRRNGGQPYVVHLVSAVRGEGS